MGVDCCTFLMCSETDRKKEHFFPSFSACGPLISMTIAAIR